MRAGMKIRRDFEEECVCVCVCVSEERQDRDAAIGDGRKNRCRNRRDVRFFLNVDSRNHKPFESIETLGVRVL